MKRRKTRKGKKRNKLIIFSFIGLTLLLTVGYAAFSTNITLSVKGNVKDKSRVIKAWTNASNEDFHTDFYRERIRTITFLDTAKVPSEVPSNQKWDVSEAGDNGVTAYVVESIEENDTYDLYIGAKHGVIANNDSSFIFYNFINVKILNFNNNYKTNNTLNMAWMFYNCQNLEELDVSNFQTSNVTNMAYMMSDCKKITTLDLKSFDTSNVTTMYAMFWRDSNLEEIKGLENFNTSKVTNMGSMFSSCHKLTQINLKNFNTTQVTNMRDMFAVCRKLETLDLSSFNTLNVTSMYQMFMSANELKTIYVSNEFVTTNLTEGDDVRMFNGATKLVGGNGTTFDSAHTDSEYARIDTNEAPGYFTLKTE